MSMSGKVIFHDVHEFEESIADTALNSNCLQVGKGLPTIRHDCLYLQDIILRRFRISHALLDGFRVRDGWTTFVLAPRLGTDLMWNGVRQLPNALGILRSGLDHDVLMPAGWSSIEIDIPDHLVDSEGLLPECVFNSAMSPEKGQLRLQATAAATARRDLAALLDSGSGRTHPVLTGDAAVALRREVLDLLARATEFDCHDEMRRPTSPTFQTHYLVRKACRMLDEQVHENPRIDTIALELGVPLRSLQRYFLTVLGVPPKQYVMARKLDFARRALCLRGQRTSVIDIAYEFGFVSASRFTEQFKRQFGQAPSTVMRITAP